MNSDPTGELGILFWSFVAVVVISAGANAFSTWTAGGSPEDCFNAAIAGGIGGAAGFGMAMFLGFTPQGNIVGRATATLVSDLTTARLNNGELTASDYAYAGVDVVMDVCYSTIGYYYTVPIRNVFVQNAVNAAFDACVDNTETYLFYNNDTPTQQTSVQRRGNYVRTGGDFRYAAYEY